LFAQGELIVGERFRRFVYLSPPLYIKNTSQISRREKMNVVPLSGEVGGKEREL
jgi:hypothetical protein